MKFGKHAITVVSAILLGAAVWAFAMFNRPSPLKRIASRIQDATTGQEWSRAVLEGLDTREIGIFMMLKDLNAILGQPYMSYPLDGRPGCMRALYCEPQPPPYGEPLPPSAIPMPWQSPEPEGWYLVVDSCNDQVTDLRLSNVHGK